MAGKKQWTLIEQVVDGALKVNPASEVIDGVMEASEAKEALFLNVGGKEVLGTEGHQTGDGVRVPRAPLLLHERRQRAPKIGRVLLLLLG